MPRIAILHTWTNTQNEGWYRIEFDRLQIPYSYISDQVVRNTPNLREKYDVIIFPPLGGSAQAIVNGIPMRGDPIPWKQSELTPNMGSSPDQTDDMRGGMGLAGVVNLQKFVQDGGLFIVIANNARIPIDFGMTSGVSIQEPRQLQARGSIFNATLQRSQESDCLWLRRDAADLFQSGAVVSGGSQTGGGGGGGGGAAEVAGSWRPRPSGRGSVTDPGHRAGNASSLAGSIASPARPGEEQLTEEQRQHWALSSRRPHSGRASFFALLRMKRIC